MDARHRLLWTCGPQCSCQFRSKIKMVSLGKSLFSPETKHCNRKAALTKSPLSLQTPRHFFEGQSFFRVRFPVWVPVQEPPEKPL